MTGDIVTGRALVEKMVTAAEDKIRDTEELLVIMELAGEDVSDEKELIGDLKLKVARYRAALNTRA